MEKKKRKKKGKSGAAYVSKIIIFPKLFQPILLKKHVLKNILYNNDNEKFII